MSSDDGMRNDILHFEDDIEDLIEEKEEDEEEDMNHFFLPLTRSQNWNPLNSNNVGQYPHILSILDNLFQSQLDRLILEEITNESLSNYSNEILRRNENIKISNDYKSIKFMGEENSRNKQCFICMEEFILNEEVLELECRHLFHKTCIENAIKYNPKCPLCKTNIKVENETINTLV